MSHEIFVSDFFVGPWGNSVFPSSMKDGSQLPSLVQHRLQRAHDTTALTIWHKQSRDEFMMLVEEPRVGLSHCPERFKAQGLRAPTPVPGLFLAGQDLTIGGMEGAMQGG